VILPSKLFMALPCRRQSMTSLIGLLLSLLACSMALVIASTDQTGQRLAELSLAFESSLSNHGVGEEHSFEDPIRLLSFRDADSEPQRTLSGASHRLSPGRTHTDSEKNEHSPLRDAKEPAFLNLLGELQRFCRVSAVDTFNGELGIDLLWPIEKSDEEIISRICDVIHSLEGQSDGSECEYQLTVWASSPVRSAFLDAALRAAKFQSQVQVTLVIRRIGRPKS
jgi:hypothetical protein